MGSKKACDILLIPVILFTLLTKKVISQFQSLLFVCVFETRHDNEFDLEQLNNRIDCFMYKWKKKHQAFILLKLSSKRFLSTSYHSSRSDLPDLPT